jgi:heme exporter protein D
MSALLDMGGYGAFVWPAYGVSVACLVAGVLLTWRAYHRAKARLALLEKP